MQYRVESASICVTRSCSSWVIAQAHTHHACYLTLSTKVVDFVYYFAFERNHGDTKLMQRKHCSARAHTHKQKSKIVALSAAVWCWDECTVQWVIDDELPQIRPLRCSPLANNVENIDLRQVWTYTSMTSKMLLPVGNQWLSEPPQNTWFFEFTESTSKTTSSLVQPLLQSSPMCPTDGIDRTVTTLWTIKKCTLLIFNINFSNVD